MPSRESPKSRLEDVQVGQSSALTLTDTVSNTNVAANKICLDIPLNQIGGDVGKAVSAAQGDCEKKLPIMVNPDCDAESLTSNVELKGQDATLLFFPNGEIEVMDGKGAIKASGEPCIDQLPGSLTALGVHIDSENEDGNVNIRFNIEEQEGGQKLVRIHVFEGRAKITTKDGVSRELSRNEQILLSPEGVIIEESPSKTTSEVFANSETLEVAEANDHVYGDTSLSLTHTVGQKDGGCEVKDGPTDATGAILFGASLLGVVAYKKAKVLGSIVISKIQNVISKL